ncbi:MAG: MGMT family protein [Bacteroidia bacterium]
MEENFFQNVYEVVKLIPKGRVTSYGAIARYLGAERSARMVGYAMNGAAATSEIPAHRVINRNGLLTGSHAFTNPSMEERLTAEGIEVKEGKVVDFDTLLWNPAVDLAL